MQLTEFWQGPWAHSSTSTSQCEPVNPGRHSQEYPAARSTQKPPFAHGDDSHSFTLSWQRTPKEWRHQQSIANKGAAILPKGTGFHSERRASDFQCQIQVIEFSVRDCVVFMKHVFPAANGGSLQSCVFMPGEIVQVFCPPWNNTVMHACIFCDVHFLLIKIKSMNSWGNVLLHCSTKGSKVQFFLLLSPFFGHATGSFVVILKLFSRATFRKFVPSSEPLWSRLPRTKKLLDQCPAEILHEHWKPRHRETNKNTGHRVTL